MMDCHEIRELLEAYVLGALDDEEETRVESHLAACPECRQLANEAADVANQLPQALTEASSLRVPPAVKVRLLETLRKSETAPAQSDGSSTPDRQRAASVDAVSPEAGRPAYVKWRSRIARWLPQWRPRTVIAVAALILLAISVVWNVRLIGVLAQERAQLAEYADLIGQQEIVLEVVDSNQTTRRVLLPPEDGSRAYGKVFTRPDMPHVVAMAARLPQPPEGQAYHLWVTRAGRTRLAGTMNVNDEGFGLLVWDVDRDGPDYESARLTLQPEGSTEPAGAPVLVWQPSESR